MNAKRFMSVEGGSGGARVFRHELQIAERRQKRDDEGDLVPVPEDAVAADPAAPGTWRGGGA